MAANSRRALRAEAANASNQGPVVTTSDDAMTVTPPALSWELLVDSALQAGASDLHVHVTPSRDAVVRARVDGVMIPWGELPASVAAPALTRMRADADLATGTALLVGEGRVRHTGPAGTCDIRLTIAPLVGGALKVAMRLPVLDLNASLDDLGFSPENLATVRGMLAAPSGLVLTTGPVGAGKTTTLLAALAEIGGPGKSVVTVEDPVERIVPGADQIEVREQSGYTYEHILRSLLRMDMDSLLIGEIRDQATAQHAVQIAKAGRLVLSTLHSGSAVEALQRLHELSGLGRLEVTESVHGIISQRLVRKVHQDCSGQGCDACLFTGFSGRVPLHEVLVVNDELREAMLAGSTKRVMQHVAERAGMRTFQQDAQRWLTAGTTTAAETERVLGRG